MTFQIENETDVTFPFDAEKLISDVVTATLDTEKCPYEADVNVLLTDDAYIREVNRDMRKIDRATDVLSFPTAMFTTPADFDELDAQPDVFHPETGEYMIGDILISVDHVKAQALLYGHSEKRELAFLVAHSVLHLIGYDHMEEAERLVMEEKQEAVLQTLGITREVSNE